MTSKHSIVQLENFVKLVSFMDLTQLSAKGFVHVLSRNPDGTNRTIWVPPLFKPSGVVISTYHPNKPQRRIIEGSSLLEALRSCIPYRKEWVTDERWHNPAIHLESKAFVSKSLLGNNLTYIFVFCFDTFHDDAGVCHWIIDTLYQESITPQSVQLQVGVWRNEIQTLRHPVHSQAWADGAMCISGTSATHYMTYEVWISLRH